MVRMVTKNPKSPGDENELEPDAVDATTATETEEEEDEWEDSPGDTDVEEDF